MAERGSFGGSRLNLAFLIQPLHVPEERLEALRRLMDVHDSRGFVARVANRVRYPRRHGRSLAGTYGAPVSVHEDLESALDHLVALLSSRVHVNRGPGIRGSTQFVASKSSPAVSSVLRVISHHIPIPGRKSSRRSSPPGVSRDGGFGLVSVGHGGPFRQARPARPLRAEAPASQFGLWTKLCLQLHRCTSRFA